MPRKEADTNGAIVLASEAATENPSVGFLPVVHGVADLDAAVSRVRENSERGARATYALCVDLDRIIHGRLYVQRLNADNVPLYSKPEQFIAAELPGMSRSTVYRYAVAGRAVATLGIAEGDFVRLGVTAVAALHRIPEEAFRRELPKLLSGELTLRRLDNMLSGPARSGSDEESPHPADRAPGRMSAATTAGESPPDAPSEPLPKGEGKPNRSPEEKAAQAAARKKEHEEQDAASKEAMAKHAIVPGPRQALVVLPRYRSKKLPKKFTKKREPIEWSEETPDGKHTLFFRLSIESGKDGGRTFYKFARWIVGDEDDATATTDAELDEREKELNRWRAFRREQRRSARQDSKRRR